MYPQHIGLLSTHGMLKKGDFPRQSLGLVHIEAAVWRFASKLNMKAILFQTHCKCEIIGWPLREIFVELVVCRTRDGGRPLGQEAECVFSAVLLCQSPLGALVVQHK